MKLYRSLMVTVGLLLALAVPSFAQTSLNSTTLAAAITDVNAKQVQLTSTSNVSAGDYLAIVSEGQVREFMIVRTVASPYVTVTRDAVGFTPAFKSKKHANGSVVYTGAKARFYTTDVAGSCTRTAEQYLPHISTTTGIVYDCINASTQPATWYAYPNVRTAKSTWFNLDNGSGTTIDDVLIRATRPLRIVACRAVYVDATTGTVAAGNWKVGTAVGGAQIVAATAYENTVAVGASTAGTIVASDVAANTAVFVRHTGVAATAAGQAYVECDYVYN